MTRPVEEPWTLIEPSRRWRAVSWRELWAARELLWALASRDIRVRYKQSIIGLRWALVRPLATMGLFAGFFTLLGTVPVRSEVPYALLLFVGLLPWQLFASVISDITPALVANQSILKRVYFPRMLLVLVPVVPRAVDFLIASTTLVVALVLWGPPLTLQALWSPVFALLMAATAVACGIWLSALNAIFRDVGHALPFALQVLFFVSPVLYEPEAVIPAPYMQLYALNPLANFLQAFRWSLLATPPPSWSMTACSVGLVLLVGLSGSFVFSRLERLVIDHV